MFIAPRSRQRHIPLRMIVPNLLTTIALCSGLASIHYSLKGDWDRALAAIGISVIFDMFDGRAARLLKASSPFGAVMDSLSDFLSFGVAPAILLHEFIIKEVEEVWGIAALMTFVLCSALRLARFTAAVKPTPPVGRPAPKPNPIATRFFVGMPTPSAAAAVLIPPMLVQSRYWHNHADTLEPWRQPWIVVFLAFLIAVLMVSRLPMYSLKKLKVNRRFVVPLLIGVGLVVVGLARDMWLTVALLSLAYLLSIPLAYLSYRRLRASLPPEPHEPDRAGGTENPPPIAAGASRV